MKMNEAKIEEILKRAVRKGRQGLEFSDEEVEFLLAHSEMVKPLSDHSQELQEILLNATKERHKAKVVAMETTEPYGTRDQTGCRAGEAMRETILANAWDQKQAADKLGVSRDTLLKLTEEMVPLTVKSVRGVSDLLSEKYQLRPGARGLLTQWLLNGLHIRDLRRVQHQSHPARAAARKKKR